MATYTSNYGWTKPSGSDNVDISVLNNNLDDQDRTIHDAFLNMAPPFSESSTYAVDDIVLYGTGLYKCRTAVVTPGSWTGSTNWQVYKLSEGGSGGGTTDYDALNNKPSINDVELSGNKTASDLGLQDELTFDNVPTDGSNNPVKSGGVYSADEAIRKWTTAEAKNVSGNPITLTDGSARNAEGLAVTCEPIQDLHGYDHPWAVGAGKNKLPMTVDGIKALNTEGTWTGNIYSYRGVNYTILTDADGNVTGITSSGTASGGNANLTLTRNLVVSNCFMSGCPSGGSTSTYFLRSEISGTYPSDIGSGIAVNGTLANIWIGVVNGNTAPSGIWYPQVESGNAKTTFEPYSNICPITGYTECVVDVKDEDETTHDTATISFGQTVYGGSVDFKTGKVTVTHAIADMGSYTWGFSSSYQSWYTDGIRDFKKGEEISGFRFAASAICDNYEYVQRAFTESDNGKTNLYFQPSTSFYRCWVKDLSTISMSAVEFKTYITGKYICYELATPTELTLTPAELELLKGYNYITTNGTTIALAYLPDSLLAEAENYVDTKIPPAPTTDGTYVLTCAVTSGTPAYSWESAT